MAQDERRKEIDRQRQAHYKSIGKSDLIMGHIETAIPLQGPPPIPSDYKKLNDADLMSLTKSVVFQRVSELTREEMLDLVEIETKLRKGKIDPVDAEAAKLKITRGALIENFDDGKPASNNTDHIKDKAHGETDSIADKDQTPGGGPGGGPKGVQPDAIDIPEDFEERSWNDLRALARQLEPGTVVTNKESALAIIRRVRDERAAADDKGDE